ncbi:MAG: RHS repeat-associated core domain-containing protein [Candidatus Sulfotelmatobacter sp.]
MNTPIYAYDVDECNYDAARSVLIQRSVSECYKFTGKERDSESGLDMFGARYYGSSLGRFMTPDWTAKPVTVPYAHFGNPQSLNLYSYVQNNPTTVGDPDGHCSSPKVGSGQVGVCIDLYIQAKTINVVGQGDNRGPAANDPKATYRTELQLLSDHFKSGQQLSLQNRPTGLAVQD